MELIEEQLFWCGHCGSSFDINKIEVYGYPKDNPKIVICEGCAKQLGAKE